MSAVAGARAPARSRLSAATALHRLHRLTAPPRPEPATPWRALVLACLGLAALSLLGPHQPTYDPWSWIVWGRETLHLDLVTTSGPSWKPLPWLFTTPFALFGSAAPQLWVLVARAGGLLAFGMAYRLAARLAGPAAGVIAAVTLALAQDFIRNFVLGNSEGLLVALCLWAAERHLDHRRRDAFVLLFAAALLRPEIWPFWALYGVWMVIGAWQERPPRVELALLGGSVVAVLVLWFVPEYIGSGDFLRAASRARQPNPDSAAYAPRPWLEVFRRSQGVLSPPVYAGAVIAVVGALIARERERAWTLRLGLGAVAAALMVVVAAMTEVGFSGNLRYVALPAAVVCVLAGVGWVDVVRWLGVRAHGALALAAVAALLAWWWPHAKLEWDAVHATWVQVHRDSNGDSDLAEAVALAGGTRAILRCGPVYTGAFHAPAVAWALGIHLDQVGLFAVPPGTVIAGRRSWLAHDPRFTTVVRTAEWHVLRRCK